MCVALTLLVTACEDMANDPLAMAVAPETHGAVLLTEGMPTVSDMVAEHGLVAHVAGELDAWWASWDLETGEGAKVRASVYPTVSRVLYPYLMEEGVADLIDAVLDDRSPFDS